MAYLSKLGINTVTTGQKINAEDFNNILEAIEAKIDPMEKIVYTQILSQSPNLSTTSITVDVYNDDYDFVKFQSSSVCTGNTTVSGGNGASSIVSDFKINKTQLISSTTAFIGYLPAFSCIQGDGNYVPGADAIVISTTNNGSKLTLIFPNGKASQVSRSTVTIEYYKYN